MDKENVVSFYLSIYYLMEYYSAIEKNEIMPFVATWMDLRIIILSEISQKQRQQSYDSTNMWNLTKMIQQNLFTKTKQRFQNQIYDYQSGNMGGMN